LGNYLTLPAAAQRFLRRLRAGAAVGPVFFFSFPSAAPLHTIWRFMYLRAQNNHSNLKLPIEKTAKIWHNKKEAKPIPEAERDK